jgi:hypothetical protein
MLKEAFDGCFQGPSDPEKVFDRTANLENTQIINYRVDPLEKWCILVGIAPGAVERYELTLRQHMHDHYSLHIQKSNEVSE